MKVRVLDGTEHSAVITSNHPASTFGLPILLVDDEPVGPAEVTQAGYEVVDPTEDECNALKAGGYQLSVSSPTSAGVGSGN
jgi:hypothetical protein